MLANIIRDERIDIVHSHGYKSDILAVLSTSFSKTATVTTPHGYTKARKPKDLIYEALGKRALRRFDRVVPLSEELQRDVIAAGVSQNKVRLILNAVDLDEVDVVVRNKRKQSSGAVNQKKLGRKLGYVGQLVPRKRVHLLIEVFDSLWRADNTTSLDIAGDGPSRPALEAQASKLPGAKSVRFHGFVEDRFSLMLDLDLFIMTSEAEGIPRVMMEAMALGLPCAAYAIDGVTDLIKHDVTGILAPDGDAQSLVHSCEQLLGNSQMIQKLTNNARLQIEERHSAKSMARDYARLYSDLLAEQAT